MYGAGSQFRRSQPGLTRTDGLISCHSVRHYQCYTASSQISAHLKLPLKLLVVDATTACFTILHNNARILHPSQPLCIRTRSFAHFGTPSFIVSGSFDRMTTHVVVGLRSLPLDCVFFVRQPAIHHSRPRVLLRVAEPIYYHSRQAMYRVADASLRPSLAHPFDRV